MMALYSSAALTPVHVAAVPKPCSRLQGHQIWPPSGAVCSCAEERQALLQVVGRDPFAADWYLLSSLEPDLAAASVPANASDNRGVFINTVAGSPSEARSALTHHPPLYKVAGLRPGDTQPSLCSEAH